MRLVVNQKLQSLVYPAINPKLWGEEIDSDLSQGICEKVNTMTLARIQTQLANPTLHADNCYMQMPKMFPLSTKG